jgi:exopolyphosphatase/guanosine-5'-triphosphate,3'-diphosphate pyrophosphatase
LTRRLAAVDLGTNTVRLLVVEAEGREWRPLHQSQRVTRLGEGQAETGRLLEAPMQRTVDTVSEFIAAARGLGASEIRVVATSAVREAPNRAELLALLRAATGLDASVVSGEEEARLTLQGVAAGLPQLGGSFVLFDIGGGSTELVLGEGGRLGAVVSLQLGLVRLAERYGDAGPVDWARFALMRGEIDGRLAREIPARIIEAQAPALVGTAGTVTTLAALDLGLPAYDASRVQGHTLARGAVERLLKRLGALAVAERARLPCLEPGRADVLIPGIAICLAVMDRLGYGSLVVSDRGLREGILCEILSAR